MNLVPESKKLALIACMCIIHIVFMTVALILFKKKFILTTDKFEQIKEEIYQRKSVGNEETIENSEVIAAE